MKTLAEGADYCRMPTQLNPNEHECPDNFNIMLAVPVAILISILPFVGLCWLVWLGREGSLNKSWNPMAGAFWGVAYILITFINALTLGHSDSVPRTLLFFELFLTVPRVGLGEFIGQIVVGVNRGSEGIKKGAADAIVMETTIGMVSLGFMIDLYLWMTARDGMSILVKTPAFHLPALGLVSSLSGLAATGLKMAKNEVKELWAFALLPLLAVSVAIVGILSPAYLFRSAILFSCLIFFSLQLKILSRFGEENFLPPLLEVKIFIHTGTAKEEASTMIKAMVSWFAMIKNCERQ